MPLSRAGGKRCVIQTDLRLFVSFRKAVSRIIYINSKY